MFFRRVIMISAATLMLLLLIGMAMRKAQAPFLIWPPDGRVERPGVTVEFKWRYGGFIYRYPIVWRRAEHFVVCIKEYAPGDFPCSYPQTTDQPPWAGAVSDFASESGAPGTSWAESIRHYTHPVVDGLPPELHGVDLMWTVAACASTAPDSCSYAIPARRLRIDDVNLTAVAAHINHIGGSNIELESTFQNTGPAPSGPFDVKLQVAQLRLNSSNDPIKDINAIGVNPATDEVFLKNGKIMLINAFVAAGGDPDDVKGILVKDGFRDAHTVHVVPGLDPGEVSFHNSPTLSITLPPGTPSETATKMFLEVIVDPDNLIVESNESEMDNTKQDRLPYSAP